MVFVILQKGDRNEKVEAMPAFSRLHTESALQLGGIAGLSFFSQIVYTRNELSILVSCQNNHHTETFTVFHSSGRFIFFLMQRNFTFRYQKQSSFLSVRPHIHSLESWPLHF